jgi:excisionase family DNA binding protein
MRSRRSLNSYGIKGVEMKGWASVKDAAKYAGFSERTMRKFLKQGLKHSRLPSGTIRIRYQDIDDYLEQFQVKEDRINVIVDGILKDFR